MQFGFVGYPGQIDHARTIEDLSSMAPLMRDGRAFPPLSLLADIGGDMLYAQRGDAGGWRMKRDAALHSLLASLPYRRAFSGTLRVSCLHVALALGRKDLHREFVAAGELRLERALQWLTLYGMDEHRLWRFLDARFVADLKRRRIPSAKGLLSPLDVILLGERPDLRRLDPPGEAGFAKALDVWLERDGIQEYKLFWTLDEAALARIAASGPQPWLEKDFVASLTAAHASGRADLLVAAPEATARQLQPVSRLSDEVREAALTLPFEAEDDPEAAPLPPRPLSGAFVEAIDFMPGDDGPRTTMTGHLGQPGARGAPLLSAMTTFFFASPRSRRVLLALDATLADEEASLLVWIDGRPADLFPAKALSARAAKVHAQRTALAAPLAIGLEIVGGRSGPPLGHLRSLAILPCRAV